MMVFRRRDLLTRGLASAALALVLLGGAALRPAHAAAAGTAAPAVTASYALLFHSGGQTYPAIDVRLSATSGTVSGFGVTQCTTTTEALVAVKGTLQGATAALAVVFLSPPGPTGCAGITLLLKGVLGPRSGYGVFTSNHVPPGTWLALRTAQERTATRGWR